MSIDSHEEGTMSGADTDGLRPNLDRNGLEVLEREECLALLRTATLGRVAVTAAALPRVFPITFCLTDDDILFRASPGTKLDAASNNSVVAFEADDFDPVSHTGWSVMVTGVAREITDAEEREVAKALQLPRWAPSEGGRIVAVSIELVSGRRIPHT